jgi:hypothetical protein
MKRLLTASLLIAALALWEALLPRNPKCGLRLVIDEYFTSGSTHAIR